MRNLLIIYPHWPPSNLAGVHRPRLLANYLADYGWHPIVLTVKHEYYEEPPDFDLVKTVSKTVEVIFTEAKPVSEKRRIIGDIGLRAWSYLKKEALQLIDSRKIDFVWIPIPSFYMAILGRVLHDKTGVLYGIDYIDPWVRDISNRKGLRSRLSLLLAKRLEPYAVKKAALISGVSEAYYQPVLERNFSGKPVKHLAFPYGFDPNDHAIRLHNLPVPWQEDGQDIRPFLYAGAFLPNSRLFVQALFKSLAHLVEIGAWSTNNKFYFVGTGLYQGKTIQEYATEAGVGHLVKEDRNRHPFLHILNWLSSAHVVLVIGSTEKHYTASKTFQAILSGRPLLSVLHKDSTAIQVLKESRADKFTILYENTWTKEKIVASFHDLLLKISKKENLADWEPDTASLMQYSSSQNAKRLATAMDQITDEKKTGHH